MDDWLKVAQSLKVGQSRKISHDCSPAGDRSLSVSHEPECYRAYCYRCKQPGLFVSKELSLGERIRINQERSAADKTLRQMKSPQPEVTDWSEWPAEAQAWLLKAGIGEAEAQRIGIYYHPPSMRVVLPYPGTHHWQARAVMQGHKPKYISDGGDRQVRVLNAHRGSIILTEDLLSAYKMSMANRAAMPLLGTTLHDEHLALILARGHTVTVWLDPDKPGQAAARKICQRLAVFGVDHRNVLGEYDPKLYSRADINRILEEAWRST